MTLIKPEGQTTTPPYPNGSNDNKNRKEKVNPEQTSKWAEGPRRVLGTVNSADTQKSKAVTVTSRGALW